VVFKKTQEGWKAMVRPTAEKLLELVKPDGTGRKDVKEYLDSAAENEQVLIIKDLLIDPKLANESRGLVLTKVRSKKTGRFVYSDPVVLDEAKLEAIVKELNLKLPSVEAVTTSSSTANDNSFTLDNIKFDYTVPTANSKKGLLKITISTASGFDDFDTLFGTKSNVSRQLVKLLGDKKYKRAASVPIDVPYDSDTGGNSLIARIAGKWRIGKALKFNYEPSKSTATYVGDVSPEVWEEMKKEKKGT